MASSDVSQRVILIVVVTRKYENSGVLRATKDNVLLWHVDYFGDGTMLTHIVNWLQFLDELSCLSGILSDETSCIANVYFSAFWAKLGSCYDKFTLLVR